jgi:hypothetical protein
MPPPRYSLDKAANSWTQPLERTPLTLQTGLRASYEPKVKAVFVWLLTVNCALCSIDGPLDPQRFGMLNHDPSLSAQLAEDSLLKWLVRNSNPNDPHESITLSFLGQEVSEAIHDGSAAQSIAADLKAGDDALYKAMARVLYSYNFSDKEALSLLDNWARLGPDKTLDSVLLNVTEGGRSLQALTGYLMEQDENWVKAVYTVRDIAAGSSTISAEILRQSLVSAAAMPPATAVALVGAAAVEDNVRDRVALSNLLPRIYQTNTPLGRYIRRQPLAEGSFYANVWRRAQTKTALDPLLASEFAARSVKAQVLYVALGQLLSDALRDQGGVYFVPELTKAAFIPHSRYSYMLETARVEGRAMRSRRDPDLGSNADPVAGPLGALTYRKDTWRAFLLWHLTRPAEAVVITIREALPQSLNGNDDAGKILIKNDFFGGSSFEKDLETDGAFGSLETATGPLGLAGTFREKAGMDNLDSKDYARFATAFGLRLAKSDSAWSYSLSSADSSGLSGKTGREALTYLLTLTIEQDAKTAEAWCRTVLQNDLLLYDHFAKWLMANGRSPSADSFQRWLTSVDQAFKANLVFGNNDVTNFKSWFCEFLKSDEGWAAVFLRLKVESILIPDAIRTCMAKEAIKETPLLWTVYSTACATSGTAVSTIKPRLAEFANRTQFPKLLLEEIEAQNQLAADAIDPIWEALLSGDSPVVERVLQSVRDGLVISNQFALAMLAFDEVASDPRYWQMMLGDAALDFRETNPETAEFQKRVRGAIQTDAANHTDLILKELQKPEILKAWQSSLVRAVRYRGKSYVIASLITQDYDLSNLWAQLCVTYVQTDPLLVRYIIESLGLRRLGDAHWTEQVENMKQELTTTLLSDRILIEQLLADHNRGYREDLITKVRTLFGHATAGHWY